MIGPDASNGVERLPLDQRLGREILKDLRARLSGLEMPTYMLDIPGGFGKVPLESAAVERTATGHRLGLFVYFGCSPKARIERFVA